MLKLKQNKINSSYIILISKQLDFSTRYFISQLTLHLDFFLGSFFRAYKRNMWEVCETYITLMTYCTGQNITQVFLSFHICTIWAGVGMLASLNLKHRRQGQSGAPIYLASICSQYSNCYTCGIQSQWSPPQICMEGTLLQCNASFLHVRGGILAAWPWISLPETLWMPFH